MKSKSGSAFARAEKTVLLHANCDRACAPELPLVGVIAIATTNKQTPQPAPVPDGLALTDRLLLALKDGDGHSLADILSRLWPQPRDRPPAAGRTTPGDPLDAERFAQLRLTARQGIKGGRNPIGSL